MLTRAHAHAHAHTDTHTHTHAHAHTRSLSGMELVLAVLADGLAAAQAAIDAAQKVRCLPCVNQLFVLNYTHAVFLQQPVVLL